MSEEDILNKEPPHTNPEEVEEDNDDTKTKVAPSEETVIQAFTENNLTHLDRILRQFNEALDEREETVILTQDMSGPGLEARRLNTAIRMRAFIKRHEEQLREVITENKVYAVVNLEFLVELAYLFESQANEVVKKEMIEKFCRIHNMKQEIDFYKKTMGLEMLDFVLSKNRKLNIKNHFTHNSLVVEFNPPLTWATDQKEGTDFGLLETEVNSICTLLVNLEGEVGVLFSAFYNVAQTIMFTEGVPRFMRLNEKNKLVGLEILERLKKFITSENDVRMLLYIVGEGARLEMFRGIEKFEEVEKHLPHN